MASTNQFMKQISAAAGRTKAELVLKHAKIVNVFTETIEEGDIAIEDGIIVGIGDYEGDVETDLKVHMSVLAFWMDICIWRVLW